MFKLFHPAVFVTAGFFLVALAQLLGPEQLPWLLLAIVPSALLLARPTWFQVVRRLRWVFLAVLILFSWQAPGRLLLPVLGNWSPSVDGVMLAAEHAGRLLVMVSVIAVLLARLDRAAWVSSLQALLQPLEVFGLSPQRFAVRLALVLSYCSTRGLDWRACLHEARSASVTDEPFTVQLSQLRARDRVLIFVLLASLAGVLWW